MWGELAARPRTLTLFHVTPTVPPSNSHWVHSLNFTPINCKNFWHAIDILRRRREFLKLMLLQEADTVYTCTSLLRRKTRACESYSDCETREGDRR